MAANTWPDEAGVVTGRVQKPPYSARISTAMNDVRPAIAALACGVAAALILAQPLQAAPFRLGDVLFGSHAEEPARPAAPMVARYVDEDGDTGFVLDRTTGMTLLRFEDSPEIWVLSAQPGPRGDVIYKNDVGELVLRATRLGGLTLFTSAHPGGAAVSLVGEAAAIRPPAVLSPNGLLQRLAQASARSSRAAQRLVVFDASDVTPQTAALIADAATVTAEAIGDMAQRRDGRQFLARLTKVTLVLGRKPSAVLRNGVLQVVVAPQDGRLPARDCVVGRPSSRRIAAAVIH